MVHIAIPTKSFEDTLFTFEYAKMWFGVENVTYHLVNAYKEPSARADTMISIKDHLLEASKEILIEQKAEITAKYPQIGKNLVLTSGYGALEDVLNGIHESKPINYVVMATSGAGKLKRVFGGSLTAKVVANINCPVISLPYRYRRANSSKEICVSLDFETPVSRELLKQIKLLAKQKDCAIKILHINNKEIDKNIKQEFENQLKIEFSNSDYGIVEIDSDSISDGIMQYVEKHDPAMLVLIAQEYGFLEGLFHQSSTKLITNISNIPLLILREK